MTCQKIVVFGSAAVGKTAITIRLVHGYFREQYDPTIEDCFRTQRQINDEIILVDILDTAGQDEFRNIREQYMTLGNGFMIVYSITEKSTFDDLNEILESLHKIRDNDVIWILLGNKCDLKDERQVSVEEANQLVEKYHGICLMETSAKNDINVEDSFVLLIKKMIEYQNNNKTNENTKEKKCLLL